MSSPVAAAAAASLQDAKENNYTALFEEHEYHGFVQSVLDAMEYQSFYQLMLTEAATTWREDGINGGGSDRGSPVQRRVDPRRQNCRLAGGSASGSDNDTGSIGTERDSDKDVGGGLRRARK